MIVFAGHSLYVFKVFSILTLPYEITITIRFADELRHLRIYPKLQLVCVS